jgi:hypothetical protein
MSILCLEEELASPSPIKKMRVFVCVFPTMTVTYEICFDTKNKMASSPPTLKCMSYCGEGTFLFPEQLLPNRFSMFIHFGKMFHHLSEQLEQHRGHFDPFLSFGSEDLYYLIQVFEFNPLIFFVYAFHLILLDLSLSLSFTLFFTLSHPISRSRDQFFSSFLSLSLLL